MERVVVNRSFTLYKTFYEGSTATDPDSPPTVIITRESDGSTVSAGAVADEATAGTWSVTVPASENDTLDNLTADWTADVNGEDQEHVDYVEVAGGPLFTLAELTALKPTNATWTDGQKAEMRTRVEQALEDACGVAFVPRYYRETFWGEGLDNVLLKWPKIRTIRSASSTYNGTTTTLSASDLTSLSWDQYSGLRGYYWTLDQPWVIDYEHGYDRPPERVKRAALSLARSWLVQGPIDDRAAVFNAGADGGTYSLVVPGRNNSVFGLPEVDATVQEYSLRLGVGG